MSQLFDEAAVLKAYDFAIARWQVDFAWPVATAVQNCLDDSFTAELLGLLPVDRNPPHRPVDTVYFWKRIYETQYANFRQRLIQSVAIGGRPGPFKVNSPRFGVATFTGPHGMGNLREFLQEELRKNGLSQEKGRKWGVWRARDGTKDRRRIRY